MILKRTACPYCRHQYFTRSRRDGIIERLISLLNIYPYRCQNYECGRRFWRWGRR